MEAKSILGMFSVGFDYVMSIHFHTENVDGKHGFAIPFLNLSDI